jgi:hypothetical protein
LGWIVQHGPIRKKALGHVVGDMQLNLKMAIIAPDAVIGGLYRIARPLQQLKIDVAPTDQRPGDIVALIALPCMQQDARKRRLVIAEGARRIDKLDEIGNGNGS